MFYINFSIKTTSYRCEPLHGIALQATKTKQPMFGKKKQDDIEAQRAKFSNAVAAYDKQLYWYIRRLVVVHEDAADVLQNTYVAAWEHYSELRDKSAILSWLYRIATREAHNHLRKVTKHAAQDIDVETSEELQRRYQNETLTGDEITQLLQKAILTLTEAQRVAFNLRYYDEMNYKEIANVMNISESTAKVHYHNAKQRIEQFLKEYE